MADPERTERLTAALDALSDIGLELAGALPRQLEEGVIGPGAAALAYERISRAVRLTVMLAMRLDAGIDLPEPSQPAAVRSSNAPDAGIESERLDEFEDFDREFTERAERGDPDETIWLTKPI